MSLLWLKYVPWSTVLANAPGLVEGAKKLAAAMRNKPDPTDPAASSELREDPGARLAALEQQQHASAELLRSLVDQNAQMAEALAALRQRATVHLRIAAIGLIAGLAALVWHFLR